MTSEMATTMVGPYHIDGLVGRGGMGEVFRAFDTRRQRTVALKLLPESLSHDQEYRERFRRESLYYSRISVRGLGVSSWPGPPDEILSGGWAMMSVWPRSRAGRRSSRRSKRCLGRGSGVVSRALARSGMSGR